MIYINEKNYTYFLLNKTPSSPLLPEAVYHNDFRICLVQYGQAIWQINEHPFPISVGDIIFLSPFQKRRFLQFGPPGFSASILALDRTAFANTVHFQFFLTQVREGHYILKEKVLSSILSEACLEAQENTPDSLELLSAKLTEFFIKAERHCHSHRNGQAAIDSDLLRVFEYIDAHITEKITLGETARLIGFTESSFSRWFSRLNGISFKKYVMSCKIDHAIHLLRTTDLRVLDVAYSCGFDSISGFYDTFRKITGTTPNHISDIPEA